MIREQLLINKKRRKREREIKRERERRERERELATEWKIKESKKKINKYLDLARGLKKLWNWGTSVWTVKNYARCKIVILTLQLFLVDLQCTFVILAPKPYILKPIPKSKFRKIIVENTTIIAHELIIWDYKS